jgi:hypothetical protein
VAVVVLTICALALWNLVSHALFSGTTRLLLGTGGF